MIVTFAHLCDYAIVAQDGKLSVLGLFDRINAPVIPWPHPSLYFAFQLRSEPTERDREYTIRIECVDSDGRKLLEGKVLLRTSAEGAAWQYQHHNQLLALHGFRFEREGTFEFIIHIDDTIAHRQVFDVIATKPTG